MKTIPILNKNLLKPTILITENGADSIRQFKAGVGREGYDIVTVTDGDAALLMLPRVCPNLIVLDIDLPKVNWIEICQLIRNDPAMSGIPLLILTARAEEVFSLSDFGLGNTDFVVKPFNPQELTLRIRRLLQTRQLTDPTVEKMTFDDLNLDLSQHEVTVQGDLIHLTVTEFKLLATLAQRRGRVQSRERLLQDVCEYNSFVETRTIDTHMRRLRSKLGMARWHLETVRGVGYRFSKSAGHDFERKMPAEPSKTNVPRSARIRNRNHRLRVML
jgi:two-component system phosphate regulon response regulator PhoB